VSFAGVMRSIHQFELDHDGSSHASLIRAGLPNTGTDLAFSHSKSRIESTRRRTTLRRPRPASNIGTRIPHACLLVYLLHTNTGEWTDNTGLVYLRARYYEPTIARFMTRDTWGGDMNQPMSYNSWLYTYANPINLTDQSGLSSIIQQESTDSRDMTYWLYEEMNANANGYYVQRIRNLPNSSNLTQKTRAVFGWIFLVKNEAKWDSKHKIENRLGNSIIMTSSYGSRWYEFSVPGNIHYGFVGRAAGFSSTMLHIGAGYAEITDPAHKERGEACCPEFCKDLIGDPWITLNVCIPLGCYYINPEWMSTLFDDPGDYWNVEFGVRLYDTYHRQMTYDQFQSYLATNGWWLTPAPVIPETRFEHLDWPYSVGYFDGPDTAKNKSIVDLLLWRFPFGD